MEGFTPVLDILENAPYGAQKAVRDEVAQMQFALRRAMDQGLAPEDMAKAEAIRDGLAAADEILEKLFK